MILPGHGNRVRFPDFPRNREEDDEARDHMERVFRSPATSMVVTPHRGAHSLSVDLRTDEISATGGHRFFALGPSAEGRIISAIVIFGS